MSVYPNDLINRMALCEYANNQTGKSIDANDIMRFPSACTWAPIELQPPKPFEKVLLTTKDGNVIIGTYDTNMGEYIAWMPLPTAYNNWK